MFKITAANENYNGQTAQINFTNGVAYTTEDKSLAWFEEHGYKVEKLEPKDDAPEAKAKPKAKE